MRGRTPQIVALGGGGFSMERDSSLLDDYVLSLTDVAAPARLLPADRLRRRRPLRRALLPPLRRELRRQPRLAVPPRPGHRRGRGRPRQPPALPGPDLRRRRQRRQHARRLARARARRRAAPRLAAGASCCAAPPPARCAGSTRRSAPSTARRAACAASACCPTPTASTTTPSPPRRAEYHRFVGDGMRPGFAADDGVALHFRRHPPAARRQLARRRLRLPRRARRATASSRRRSRSPTWRGCAADTPSTAGRARRDGGGARPRRHADPAKSRRPRRRSARRSAPSA